MATIATAVRDDSGQSPLDTVLKAIADVYVEYDEPPDGQFDVALYLIDHDCGGDQERDQLLIEACYWGKVDMVKELVERHKVDPNSEFVTNQQYTIHHITRYRYRE